MNHDMNPDPGASLSDDSAEREWRTQERALADERAGHPSADEPRLRAYRLIARVAGQPPSIALPPDFAQRTARAISECQRTDEGRFERNLLLLLAGLLGVAGGAALVQFAPAWLPAFSGTAALLDKPWPWALAACLGLSGLSGRWQRGARHA
jgi:hypothetical protein